VLDHKRQILAQFSDFPRWVETRDLLLNPESFLRGGGRDFVVWSAADQLASVVGEPFKEWIQEAARVATEILAFPEHIRATLQALPGWHAELATILEAPENVQHSARHVCRVLTKAELAEAPRLRKPLKQELLDAANHSVVVAAFDHTTPVAFAYAASQSETLWDVSIDTLSTHRREGYAASAVLTLMEHMKDQGKTAVWGALQSNDASLQLAKKLGFHVVDELWVLTRQ
jgi:hypothetical protein